MPDPLSVADGEPTEGRIMTAQGQMDGDVPVLSLVEWRPLPFIGLAAPQKPTTLAAFAFRFQLALTRRRISLVTISVEKVLSELEYKPSTIDITMV